MEPATFGNYIDGEWTPSAAGRTFENRNPADTTELVGRFADSGPEDVERAVAAARAAFPKWKALPAPKRGEILYRAAEILVARGHVPPSPKTPGEVALYLVALTKSKPKGWEGELGKALAHPIPYVQKLALERVPAPVPPDTMTLRRPTTHWERNSATVVVRVPKEMRSSVP